MGEGEVGVKDCSTHCLELGDGGDSRDRVEEWEVGLPSLEDLTPLSQALISPELASAFSITPEPCRTMLDVSRASRTAITSLQRRDLSVSGVKVIPLFGEDEKKGGGGNPVVVEERGRDEGNNKVSDEGSELRKVRRIENTEDIYSAIRMENSSNCNSNEDQSAARSNSSKRQRLVWTPQLHKRFVDAVAHLGIKNAVPKTIMQLMNVEGLTRENVASHLQKYRLYLKRMQGLSNEGPSASDKLFSSTPVPQSLREPAAAGTGSGHVPMPMPMPMPYAPPMMTYGNGGMVPQMVPYHGFDMNQYSMYREQQKDWNGHKFASYMSQQHVAPQK